MMKLTKSDELQLTFIVEPLLTTSK